jgi:hypothetical protein
VTFELSEKSGETHLHFTHTGLPTEESKAQHEHGWQGCVARLEALLAA